MKKTYTVIYNPKRWFVGDFDAAWGQVKVEAPTYAEAQDAAHIAAKELGAKHGLYSWRLEERLPTQLKRSFTKYKIA